MFAKSSARALIVLVTIATFIAHTAEARPVQYAPPLSRSVGLARDSLIEPLDEEGIVARMINARMPSRRAHSQPMFQRGLLDDTLRGLPLQIIPGWIQISDMLLGDGKTSKGMLGALTGLLLTVEPGSADGSANATTSSDDPSSGGNSTAVEEAAKASQRYTLIASKKNRSQVFLVPAQQLDATVNATDSTSPAMSKNETMPVKMLIHMLDKSGAPMVMCASYGATPPTDLAVEQCTGDDQTATATVDSNDNSTDTSASASASASKQLFNYKPSTGEVMPMFDAAPMSSGDDQDPPLLSGNSTANATADGATSGKQSEMRMKFILATEVKDDEDSNASATTTTESSTMAMPTATSTSVSRKIRLGKQLIKNKAAPKLNVESSTLSCDGSSTASAAPTPEATA